MGPRAGGGTKTLEQRGNSTTRHLQARGRLLPVLLGLLSSLPLKAWLGKGLGPGFPLGQVPPPQISCSPSILLPGDHPTRSGGVGGGVGGCPVFVQCPASHRAWQAALAPCPEHGISPPLAADSLDSSASSHTTGLAPGSQWLSGQPVHTCALIINVGQRSKKERKKKERKWKGRVEGMPVSVVFKMSILFSSIF